MEALTKMTRIEIVISGRDAHGSTPDELGRFMAQQLEAWRRAFNDAGMKPE